MAHSVVAGDTQHPAECWSEAQGPAVLGQSHLQTLVWLLSPWISVRRAEGPAEHGQPEGGARLFLALAPPGGRQDLSQSGGLMVYYQTRDISAFLHDQLQDMGQGRAPVPMNCLEEEESGV